MYADGLRRVTWWIAHSNYATKMMKFSAILGIFWADAKVISMAAHIRFVGPADAAGIVAIYAPYCESTCVSFEIVAPSIEQMEQRIIHVTAGYPWLIGEIDGQIAGYVYATRHRERAAYRWSVDVAVYVATHCQRRGIGRILYQALFSILREQGYFKAFAGVSLPNAASIALHERMGFRRAAVFSGVGYKFGRWLDVGWWHLDLQPERPDPADPHLFSSIRNSSAVAAILAEAQGKLAAEMEAR
jgi:L-amino acid N-acyltransferase YncA